MYYFNLFERWMNSRWPNKDTLCACAVWIGSEGTSSTRKSPCICNTSVLVKQMVKGKRNFQTFGQIPVWGCMFRWNNGTCLYVLLKKVLSLIGQNIFVNKVATAFCSYGVCVFLSVASSPMCSVYIAVITKIVWTVFLNYSSAW